MSDESLFSKETTVARSRQDIVIFFYLQRLEDLLRADKAYNKAEVTSTDKREAGLERVACLKSLFLLCKPRLKEKSSSVKKDKIYIYSVKIFEALFTEKNYSKITELLVEYLETDLKLTQIAKMADYDRTNIILSNKMKGYK